MLMLYENSWMKKKDRVAVRALFVLVLVVAGCDVTTTLVWMTRQNPHACDFLSDGILVFSIVV